MYSLIIILKYRWRISSDRWPFWFREGPVWLPGRPGRFQLRGQNLPRRRPPNCWKGDPSTRQGAWRGSLASLGCELDGWKRWKPSISSRLYDAWCIRTKSRMNYISHLENSIPFEIEFKTKNKKKTIGTGGRTCFGLHERQRITKISGTEPLTDCENG